MRVTMIAAGVLLGLGLARPALAEVTRYALVFGSNRGHADERDLRYAERDVHRIADTLAEHGGFARHRVFRLMGASASEIRTAAIDLNLTIQRDLRAARERGEHGDAVLFVYYSGHGDARAMHLGATDLPLDEFSKLVRLSEAKLKILVLDACRSGGLTRVKGGRPVAPFAISSEDRLNNEGYAIITSSAAGEDAQESESLQSSIFTHYFRSGLLGSGDTNRDNKVTLGEAYAYAYEQTLKASMRTVTGFQHPTFDFDMSGRADPVLTDLTSARDQARLTLTAVGDYLVMLKDTETVIVEANTKAPNVIIALPAADYVVRLRGRTSIYQGDVRLKGGETKSIGPDTMRPMPYAMVVRKGDTALRLAQGPTVTGVIHGPLGAGYSPMVGAQVGYAIELPAISLMPRVGFQGGVSNRLGQDTVSHTLREISFEITAFKAFDVGDFTLAPLVSAGIGLIRQTIRARCDEPAPNCVAGSSVTDSNPTTAIISVGALGGYALSRGFSLTVAGELTNFVFQEQSDHNSPSTAWRFSRLVGVPTYRATLGIGYRF